MANYDLLELFVDFYKLKPLKSAKNEINIASILGITI